MTSLYQRDEDAYEIPCRVRNKLDLDRSSDQLVLTKF